MQSRVRMSQIYGQLQTIWSQARHLTPRAAGTSDTMGSPFPTQGVCEGLPALAERGQGRQSPQKLTWAVLAQAWHRDTLIVW